MLDRDPKAAHEFRISRNWRRAARCWRGPLNPTKHHVELVELIFAIAGPAFQSAYDEFRADPDGQRLLRDKPALAPVLADTDGLSSLPRGTLGHAYHDFMGQNRLDAGLYDEARYLRDIGARLGWDDDFAYVVHRGLIVHDLLHVIGGYGPDVGGEIGVVGFTHGQVPNMGTRSLIFFAQFFRTGVPRSRVRQHWDEAVRRGRGARMMMAQPYEELMDLPLDEIRQSLDVVPFAQAHPGGRLYLDFQYGKKHSRSLDAAIPPYVYESTPSEGISL